MDFIYVLFLLLFTGFTHNPKPVSTDGGLKAADIIARSAGVNSSIGKAINDVTSSGSSAANFVHIGIVNPTDSGVYVIHAAAARGVVYDTLTAFTTSDSQRFYAAIYRLPESLDLDEEGIITAALAHLGKGYDKAFGWSSDSIYCSELVYKAFEPYGFFKTNPMTFKDLKTGKTHPTWISHYKELGAPIPEGEMGCNPNGLIATEGLTLIKTYLPAKL